MGPWLAFLFIAGRSALAFPEKNDCPETLCKDGPACNCKCSSYFITFSTLYKLTCPGIESSEITQNFDVVIHPSSIGVVTGISCTSSIKSSEYGLFRGLNLGPSFSFVLTSCPLPTVPFSQLFQYIRVSNVQDFFFHSYTNCSNLLKRDHLKGLRDIRQLTLSNNMLTHLPEDLLLDMGNLTWLNLNDNLLDGLPTTFFRPVSKLKGLALRANNLSYLEPGTFKNLTELGYLTLADNRLKNLSRGLFSGLANNLAHLDLQNNSLTTLPPEIFSDLSKLKLIILDGNSFISLPQGLFSSNLLLEAFQMAYNRVELVVPPGLLANLTKLQEVSMHHCSFSTLPEDFLWGSIGITNVNLSKNSIISLPAKLFKDNYNLKTVDLGYNKITSVPDEFFYSQSNLVELNLSNNEIKNISFSFFTGMQYSLRNLDLSHNNINRIASDTFPPSSLTTVDLSHNEISDLQLREGDLSGAGGDISNGTESAFVWSNDLRRLNLAHNRLKHMSYDDWHNKLTFLEHLDLSHNNLSTITVRDVYFRSNSLELDLRHNIISTADFTDSGWLANVRIQSGKKSSRVSLKGNPFKCDCHIYDFMRLIRDEEVLKKYYFVEITDDPSDLICHDPAIRQSKSFEEVLPDDVTCPWEEHSNSKCPSHCTCTYRPHEHSLIVDCSNKNLTSWPKALPLWTEWEQDVKANQTVLYLSHNHLSTMPEHLHHSYRNVTFLYLSYNHLKRVNLTHFSPNLQVLELNNNNFSTLGKALQQIENLNHLYALTLRNNPWQCDCSAEQFLKFIQTDSRKVDYSNISCSTGEKFENLTSSDLCPFPTTPIFIGSAIIALIGLLIGGLFAVYYRYQRAIDVWLYAHGMCLWFVTEEELDKDKIFDAFISYSSEDESFVVNELVEVLEGKQPKYKLCLHYRDWIAGAFITEQIARSVDESKRTVVVLSPSFLKSVWGRMEFRTAHSQALKEKRCKVIVILYGDIGNTENLDPELKSYLAMNTYVKWGDPWFWEKLFYALPHPPEVTTGIPSFFRRRRRDFDQKSIDNTVNPAHIELEPL